MQVFLGVEIRSGTMVPCESLIHQPIVMTQLITSKKQSSIFITARSDIILKIIYKTTARAEQNCRASFSQNDFVLKHPAPLT